MISDEPNKRIKYPRTVHLPWSPGATSDDIVSPDLSALVGRDVVITEKMDGENTTLYRDGLHARSIESAFHPSRAWVRRFHGGIARDIPENWRVCGENVYARHSIPYEDLPGFFLAFSVWNEKNECLSWDETVIACEMLGIPMVPILYRGVWNEGVARAIVVETGRSEGYVVRLADSFPFASFQRAVFKWVRQGHVQTDEHWMHKSVVANKMQTGKETP